MPTATTTSLKLDAEMKGRVQKLAASQRRTAHWIMREAIEQYVEREEWQEQFRLDTLAAIDHYQSTGLHLTDEEVDEWITKLEAGENPAAPECHV